MLIMRYLIILLSLGCLGCNPDDGPPDPGWDENLYIYFWDLDKEQYHDLEDYDEEYLYYAWTEDRYCEALEDYIVYVNTIYGVSFATWLGMERYHSKPDYWILTDYLIDLSVDIDEAPCIQDGPFNGLQIMSYGAADATGTLINLQ